MKFTRTLTLQHLTRRTSSLTISTNMYLAHRTSFLPKQWSPRIVDFFLHKTSIFSFLLHLTSEFTTLLIYWARLPSKLISRFLVILNNSYFVYDITSYRRNGFFLSLSRAMLLLLQ